MNRGATIVFICLVANFGAIVAQYEEVVEAGVAPVASAPLKKRQYIAPAVPVAPAPGVVVNPVGQCPGGPSLPIECDPKRPWPQCPPQSYCYATNSVDIGPYFCCPVWSTYGAAWRPATPFYNYVPPVPQNWPEALRAAAAWPAAAVSLPTGFVRRKEQAKLNDQDQTKIETSMNKWLDRQAKLL